MISKYHIFCKVVETKSFTDAASQIGYTQSAVSQAIKSLEEELGTVLLWRKKDGLALTKDGEQYLPYMQAICAAEEALDKKQHEMDGLENSEIAIGTFTSVSRNLLPKLMQQFKESHPGVRFLLRQGDYTDIIRWIKSGNIDFGFIDGEIVSDLTYKTLYQEEMMAVLPPNHLLAKSDAITLNQLAKEPFILLDEGEHSVTRRAFEKKGLKPKIEYEVYDDYSILAMVRQNLGVSLMYRLVVTGFEEGLEVRPVKDAPVRTMALAWHNWETMSLASQRFVEFTIEHTQGNL